VAEHLRRGPSKEVFLFDGWQRSDRLDSAEVASEIYLSGNRDTNTLARLIFHEVLHNLLQWKDAELHANKGIAGSPVGLELKQSDVELMKKAFQTQQKLRQWTGGFLSTYDPLNDMGL
jgi:hypothetical protein